MPFHRLLNKYIGDNFSNFMTQYEATRTVSETILESMPQLGLQIYMIIYCRTYGCNFQNGDFYGICYIFPLIFWYYFCTYYNKSRQNYPSVCEMLQLDPCE